MVLVGGENLVFEVVGVFGFFFFGDVEEGVVVGGLFDGGDVVDLLWDFGVGIEIVDVDCVIV